MKIKDIIRRADTILEVLDARMPNLTRNRSLEEFAKNKGLKLILVINKIDIISAKTLRGIEKNFLGMNYVLASTKTKKGISEILSKIKENSKVAVIGYPNTGKSSLINALSKGGKTRTSPESGFTKGVQMISGKNKIMLLDTPGVIPIHDEIRLGLVSGISPAKLKDPDLVALKLISLFKNNNKGALKKYGINPEITPEEILLEFGMKRHMFKKGGLVDEKRAAINLLRLWHDGKIRL